MHARVAWLSEQVLVVDLGARTRGLQIQALFRRLGHPRAAALATMRPEEVPDAALRELPIHATHLHACCECKRFANAVVLDGGKGGQTFNELGVAIAMVCTECRGPDAGSVHIRCAKRSSAALRSAVQFEEEMATQQVEGCARDATLVATLMRQPKSTGAGNSDSGVAARVRRDAKNALEQRAKATACGEAPMLRVPAVGRAIRLRDAGTRRAAAAHLSRGPAPPALRRRAVLPAVRRRDARRRRDANGGRGGEARRRQQGAMATAGAVCRFSGKVEQPNHAGARWKVIKAPLDVAGREQVAAAAAQDGVLLPGARRIEGCRRRTARCRRACASHLAHNAKPKATRRDAQARAPARPTWALTTRRQGSAPRSASWARSAVAAQDSRSEECGERAVLHRDTATMS